MESHVPLALGFVQHIIKCIENDDKAGLYIIKQQLANRAYNVENRVRIRHSSIIPLN